MFIHISKYAASIVITYKSASKRSRILVITQIRTFSLNLSTYNKNFQTTKYSLERSPQKELEDQKKIFLKFFRKTLRSNPKQKF